MQGRDANAILMRLSQEGIVPVVRMHSLDLANKAVQALAQAGFRTFEITLTIPGAIGLIQDLSKDPGLLIGAGTVVDVIGTEASLRAGAKFVVSPCIVKGLPELCKEAGVLSIMNGLTPHEIFTAWREGSGAVKVFPVHSVGGPGHIKSLKAVFPEIPLVPTGGINLHNLKDHLLAGAAFVGTGSDLVGEQIMVESGFEGITEQAQKYLEVARTARQGG